MTVPEIQRRILYLYGLYDSHYFSNNAGCHRTISWRSGQQLLISRYVDPITHSAVQSSLYQHHENTYFKIPYRLLMFVYIVVCGGLVSHCIISIMLILNPVLIIMKVIVQQFQTNQEGFINCESAYFKCVKTKTNNFTLNSITYW